MVRSCVVCSKPFEAKRETAKYCTKACASRATRMRQAGQVLPLASVAAPPEPKKPATNLHAAVLAELEVAGRSQSVLGQMVLSMAERIDAGGLTDAAFASLMKELRSMRETALVGARVAADPMDELRARRDRRGA